MIAILKMSLIVLLVLLVPCIGLANDWDFVDQLKAKSFPEERALTLATYLPEEQIMIAFYYRASDIWHITVTNFGRRTLTWHSRIPIEDNERCYIWKIMEITNLRHHKGKLQMAGRIHHPSYYRNGKHFLEAIKEYIEPLQSATESASEVLKRISVH
jgi:hypothetical protein